MLLGIECIGQTLPNLFLQVFVIAIVKLRSRDGAFRLAYLGAQFIDYRADFLDLRVRKFNRVHYRLFFYFFRSGFNHHDGIGGPYHHDVEQTLIHLGVGGVGDQAAIDQSNAYRSDRSKEWNVRKSKCGGSGINAKNVRIIFVVSGQHEGDDLGFALETVGKHGAHRPVDLAAGEHFALTHASFALDKAAGDASSGIGIFAVVNREREKVDALAGLRIRDCGRQHYVFAHADDGRSVGLLGQFSGFKRDVFAAREFNVGNGGFRLHRSILFGQEAAHAARSSRVGGCQWLGVGKRTLVEALGVYNRLHTEPVALTCGCRASK